MSGEQGAGLRRCPETGGERGDGAPWGSPGGRDGPEARPPGGTGLPGNSFPGNSSPVTASTERLSTAAPKPRP